MASTGVFALTRFTAIAAGDVIPAVHLSDTSQNAHGSLDAITITNFFASIPVPVIVAIGTITASTPAFSSTATWNAVGTTFVHQFVNVTDTTSAAGSLLADWQVGGVSKFSVSKAGVVTATTFVGNVTGNASGTAATVTGAAQTAITSVGTLTALTVTGTITTATSFTSTTALATLSALAATQGSFYASTVSGATVQGYGTTGDVTLKNRAGTDVLVVTSNTLNVTMAGGLKVTGQYGPAAIYALSDAAPIALDWVNGNVQEMTLTASRTWTFANPVSGARYVIVLAQGGSGSYTVTWPTIKWAGGSAPTLTTTVGKKDVVTLIYDGTDYIGAAVLNA